MFSTTLLCNRRSRIAAVMASSPAKIPGQSLTDLLVVTGVDGSKEMLEEARHLAVMGDVDVSLEQVSWENLDAFLAERHFDLIFLLGNSLAHAKRNAIPGLLANMMVGLNAGGVLAFDFRPWVNDGTGRLVEPGRVIGVTKWLGRFEVGGRDCWIDEVCSYDADIQYVQYSVHHCLRKDRSEDRRFVLQYTPFDPEDVKNWLTKCGFTEESIAFIKTDYWPYLIVLARAK
jgi:SAM-dependent methyltransferase